jgi:hypothetical protein
MTEGGQFVERLEEALGRSGLADCRIIGSDIASPYSATVVVEWVGVRAKFLFDRYDYWIEVAAPSEPNEWLYLPYVLGADESARSDGPPFSVAKDWDGLLRMMGELVRSLPRLQRLLAGDAYENTKRSVSAIEQKLAQ